MNNLLYGEYEHQKVATISWPFVRYEALIPEQIKGDLFVWLYLSLFTYKSEQNGLAKNTYSESVKDEVKTILLDKFGKVIDSQTLEKIISNAERDYVVFNGGIGSLKAEVFGFLETYEELFSDKLQMKHIFQDGITGDVVPDFSDDFDGLKNKEAHGDDVAFSANLNSNLKKPGKRAVQNAFNKFTLINKGQQIPEQETIEYEDSDIAFDEFDDEDREEFFDTLQDDNLFEEENPKDKKKFITNIRNYAIRYYDELKRVYNLKVDLYIEKNQVYAISPFDEATDQWINRSLLKARNINADLDNYLREIENTYTVKQDKEELEKFFGYKDKVSDQLKYCGPLFRLIASTNNFEAKKTTIELDSLFESQSKFFFSEVGTFLEYIIEPFKRNNSDERQNVTKEAFLSEIEYKCSAKGIDYRRLTFKEIYKNWIEGWDHFKADTADIIISTAINNSPVIYSDFINDLFELYDLRNVNGHKKKKGDSRSEIRPSQEHLDKLIKVTKVLISIY